MTMPLPMSVHVNVNALQGWRILGTAVRRTWSTGGGEGGAYNTYPAVQRSPQHCWTWVSTTCYNLWRSDVILFYSFIWAFMSSTEISKSLIRKTIELPLQVIRLLQSIYHWIKCRKTLTNIHNNLHYGTRLCLYVMHPVDLAFKYTTVKQ